jgi:hypothetical protein
LALTFDVDVDVDVGVDVDVEVEFVLVVVFVVVVLVFCVVVGEGLQVWMELEDSHMQNRTPVHRQQQILRQQHQVLAPIGGTSPIKDLP